MCFSFSGHMHNQFLTKIYEGKVVEEDKMVAFLKNVGKRDAS